MAVTQRERELHLKVGRLFLRRRLVIDWRVTPDICLAIPLGDRSVGCGEEGKLQGHKIPIRPIAPSPFLLLSSASALGALRAAVTAIPIKYGRSKFRGTYQELWLNAFWLTHCLPPSLRPPSPSPILWVSGFLVYMENSKPARETRPSLDRGREEGSRLRKPRDGRGRTRSNPMT